MFIMLITNLICLFPCSDDPGARAGGVPDGPGLPLRRPLLPRRPHLQWGRVRHRLGLHARHHGDGYQCLLPLPITIHRHEAHGWYRGPWICIAAVGREWGGWNYTGTVAMPQQARDWQKRDWLRLHAGYFGMARSGFCPFLSQYTYMKLMDGTSDHGYV